MDWLVVAAVLFVVFGMIQKAAKGGPTLPGVAPVQAALEPIRTLPAGRMQLAMEGSSSEGEVDELAGNANEYGYDLAADDEEDAEDEEAARPGHYLLMSTDARPLPAAPQGLEREVDWTAEHERFHKRYVDAPAEVLPVHHGLLEQLRDPAELRRAVLMSEILGPPVSMRDPRGER